MRRKVGTVLSEEILKKTKIRAAQEGKTLSQVLETALQIYLDRQKEPDGARLVEKSWGLFHISPKELKEAMKGDLLET
ncbi:MAG: hypothetical protein O7B35_02735 [Deltaproteobacteria bacterium]|nr:hypothetical protein [Deltaproteobacteria bacterium]